MGQTKVILDGWCEGGFRQQRDECGGSVTKRERQEGVESPGAYVDDLDPRGHLCLIPVFIWTALVRSGGLSPGKDAAA